MSQIHTLLVSLWALIQAHPGQAATYAVIALNIACVVAMKKLQQDSKLYHFCKVVLGFISSGLEILNGVRGMMGKAPIVLGKPADPSTAPTPPGGTVAPIARALMLALACALAFWPRASMAGPDFSTGYSPAGLLIHLSDPVTGKPSTSQLAYATGWQASLGWLPATIGGASYDMISLQAIVLGSLGPDSRQAALAVGPATLQGMFGLLFGADLLADYGNGLEGALAGKVAKHNLFCVVTFNLNFLLGQDPIHPATGLVKGWHFALASQPPG